jgi:hypothetical protein
LDELLIHVASSKYHHPFEYLYALSEIGKAKEQEKGGREVGYVLVEKGGESSSDTPPPG